MLVPPSPTRFFFTCLCAVFLALPAAAETTYVQVGAFRRDDGAEHLRRAMIDSGFAASIERSGELRRVVVGPFEGQSEAAAARERLAAQGVQGFVRLGAIEVQKAAPPLERRVEAPPKSEPAPPPSQPAAETIVVKTAAAGRLLDLDSYYFLQVGAFVPRAPAELMVSKLAAEGYAAIIVPGPQMNRVIVGPYRSKSEAEAESAALAKKGFESFVRRGPPPLASSSGADSLASIRHAIVPQPPPERFELLAESRLEPQAVSLGAGEGPPQIGPRPLPPDLPVQVRPRVAGPVRPPPAEKLETELALAAPPPVREIAPAPPVGGLLRIAVLEGMWARNDVRQGTGASPAVSVLDEDGEPLPNAVVTYQLPDRGASGSFANGARSVTMVTAGDGVARAVGFEPNSVPGQFEIRVTASHQGLQATQRIVQTNVQPADRGRTAAKIFGSVGAGVALWSLVRYLRRDETTVRQPQPPTAVIGAASVGQPTLGAP